MQTGAATVENSMKFPQKIKNGTTVWLRDSPSGNISEETWNTNLKEYMHLYVHCSIIYNSQDMETAQVSTSRWVDKKDVVHLHNGILLGSKKEEWMNLEIIKLSEISQSEKDKHHMTSLYMESDQQN